MNTVKTLSFVVIVSCSFVFACQSYKKPSVEIKPPPPVANAIQCKDPRPQVCTREYKPVCATRDTGVRCVTTPCPSTELVTKSNACTACSDKKVYSHVPGACS